MRTREELAEARRQKRKAAEKLRERRAYLRKLDRERVERAVGEALDAMFAANLQCVDPAAQLRYIVLWQYHDDHKVLWELCSTIEQAKACVQRIERTDKVIRVIRYGTADA